MAAVVEVLLSLGIIFLLDHLLPLFIAFVEVSCILGRISRPLFLIFKLELFGVLCQKLLPPHLFLPELLLLSIEIKMLEMLKPYPLDLGRITFDVNQIAKHKLIYYNFST
jgi:hypothetical protein